MTGKVGGFTEVATSCDYLAWAHGDGDTIVSSSPVILLGYTIGATLTGTFALRDGTTASGVLLHTSATNAAAGVTVDMFGVKCNSGLFVDDAATGGNVTVFYRLQ